MARSWCTEKKKKKQENDMNKYDLGDLSSRPIASLKQTMSSASTFYDRSHNCDENSRHLRLNLDRMKYLLSLQFIAKPMYGFK